MKIVSWNINGLRSILTKGFREIVTELNPDIICLQETRAHAGAVELGLKGYNEFLNPAVRKGYSGTAILTKVQPLKVSAGMKIAEHDNEGRVLTAEYEKFFLVSVYTPNSKRDLSRLEYRMEWDRVFLSFIKKLEKKKPVIFCGDLNVAHMEIDLTNPKANVKNHGFTPQERQGFSQVLEAGFVDSFRIFHKEGGHYTWWSQMNNCRTRNIGWRLDYICVSNALVPRIKQAEILSKVIGSDHCPVMIRLGKN